MRKVVYDMDGVILNLNGYVFDSLGIDESKLKFYNPKANIGVITNEQVRLIEQAYRDVNSFKNAKLFYGAGDLTGVGDGFDCGVFVHTQSYTQEIADCKDTILESIGFSSDRVLHDVGNTKSVLNDVYVLVEDSLENAMKALAHHVILIRKHNNDPEVYGISLKDFPNIEIVDDLNAANERVRELLKTDIPRKYNICAKGKEISNTMFNLTYTELGVIKRVLSKINATSLGYSPEFDLETYHGKMIIDSNHEDTFMKFIEQVDGE